MICQRSWYLHCTTHFNPVWHKKMPQGLLSICFLSVKQPHVLAHSETTHWTDLSENSENTVLDKTIEIKLFNFYCKAILSPLFFFFFSFLHLLLSSPRVMEKKKHLVNKTSLKGISCCSSLVAEKKTNIHYSGTKTLRRPSRPPCPPIVSLLELCRVILPNNTSINVYMILKCHIMISLL